MKLRNKKTGEHGEYQVVSAGYLIRVRNCDTNESYQYDCIAGLNEDWEDYKPAEPQIKDRYPREAVRNWAEVVGGKDDISVIVGYDRTTFETKYGAKIVFTKVLDFTDEEFYEPKVLHRTITELCGEEEE